MRPRLHFTAGTGWINDPHGVTFRDGHYHLFHQHVPDGVEWAPGCHWGHASSPDLLAWTRHDTALAPGDGDDGIWTGALVDPSGDAAGARILYTAVALPDLGVGRVRIARPVDATWETWSKGEVVALPPAGLDLVAFRDPFVMREDPGWRMLVGAASRSGEAIALTYTSPDLVAWEHDGVLLSRDSRETEPVWTGSLWECPQLAEVDGHRALVFSVWSDHVLHHVAYALGGPESYAGGRLAPERWDRLSHGGSYYAPTLFHDREGRPCLLFWMRGVADERDGWAGCLSVPHVLSVDGGRLVASPHPELELRRGAELPAGVPAATFDLEWSPGAGGRLVLGATSGAGTVVSAADGRITLRRPGQEPWSMPWTGEALRVVVDGPVVEIASPRGLLGGPITPATGWASADGPCRAWRLGDG